MSLPYANPVSPGPVAGPWRRLAGVAKGLRVMLILTAVANGLLIAALLALHRTVDNFLDGDGSLGAVDDAVDFANLATFLVAAFTITVFVLTIVWEWRLAKNHRTPRPAGHDLRPRLGHRRLVHPPRQPRAADPAVQGPVEGLRPWSAARLGVEAARRRPPVGLVGGLRRLIVLDWASVFKSTTTSTRSWTSTASSTGSSGWGSPPTPSASSPPSCSSSSCGA